MIHRERRLPPRLTSRGREALTLVLLYAGFSALWILLSDRAVYWLLEDSAQLALVGAIKGWVFVAVTSALLFLLLRRRPMAADPPLPLAFERPRRQMLWALAGLMLVIVAVTALSIAHNYRSEKTRIAAQLQAISSSKSQQLWDWHLERMSDAMGVQNNPDLNTHWNAWRHTGQELHRDHLQQHLRSLLIGAHYARALILDANGVQLQHTDYQSPANDPHLQEAFLSLLSDRSPRRVGPWIDPAGVLRLAFMAPVGLDGPHPAAVVLHIDPSEALHPVLQTWPLPQRSAETLLLQRDGSDVLFLNALRHEASGPMGKRLSLTGDETVSTRFLSGRQSPGTLAEGPDYRGVDTLAVAQPVGQSEWWLLVRQDRSELMASAVVSGLWMALAGLLALFAAGVAVYLYEQRRRLMRSAHDIDELRHIRDALAESEARYRLLAENGSDVVWLLDVQSRRFLYLSPSIVKLRGYTAAEVMEQSLADMLTPESLERAQHEIERRLAALAAGDESARTATNELVQWHKDGRRIETELVSTFVTDPDGRIRVLQGVTRDITARKQAQAQILRLSQATEQSPASVVITGLDARIEYVNSAFERISGYTREEVIGQNPRLLQSGMTPREIYTAMWKALQAGQSWSGEIINRHKSGRDYLQTVTIAPVRNDRGEVTHYLSVQLDITAQRRAEEKAHELAWFDPLTGLPNRHRLLSTLHDTLGSDARSGNQSALLLLNINRFKTINDALGHSAGDVLLQRIVERLSGLVAPGDLLARLGADEFALLLCDPDRSAETISSQALRMAEALHASLDQPFFLTGGETINVTASIGVTLLPMEKQDSPGEVLRRADTALHRAKGSSGRQTAFFDATMGEVVSQRFAIEQDLRRGLAEGELRLPVPSAPGQRPGPHRQRRGPGALAAPRAWPGAARPVHPGGRGKPPDHGSGWLGAARSLPAARPAAPSGPAPAHRGQRQSAPVPRPRLPVVRDEHPGPHRRFTERSHPRDHRGHRDRTARHRGAQNEPAHAAWRAVLDRRLRHRLLLPGLPQAPAHPRTQDRPQFRAGRPQRPQRRRAGGSHPVGGTPPAAQGGRRGGRNRGTGRVPQCPWPGHPPGLPVRPPRAGRGPAGPLAGHSTLSNRSR